MTIMPVNAARAGQRFVWGNQIQRNRQNIVSELQRPVIEHVSWSASGLNLQGISPVPASPISTPDPVADARSSRPCR